MPANDVITRRNLILAVASAAVAIDSPKLSAGIQGKAGEARDSDQKDRVDERVAYVATFNPNEGQESSVEKILREMASSTRKEPGCLRYDLYKASGTPTALVLFEIYTSEAAHQAHRATAHYKTFRASVNELLKRPSQALVLHGLDVVL